MFTNQRPNSDGRSDELRLAELLKLWIAPQEGSSPADFQGYGFSSDCDNR
jgi:hypothetical protein